jgi:hypothetical protein
MEETPAINGVEERMGSVSWWCEEGKWRERRRRWVVLLRGTAVAMLPEARRRDGKGGLAGWDGKGQIKTPGGERRSGAGEKGIGNAAILVEERGEDEQTPAMVDFAEPAWTEQEHD